MTESINSDISPRNIPSELLARYRKSGPRYTSYPTAPQFTTEFDETAVVQRWRNSNGAAGQDAPGMSLYVHIPFCRSRCNYCGCHTRVECADATVQTYVAALKDHLSWLLDVIDPSRPVEQMAFGGGTPTYLSPDTMAKLMEEFRSRLNFPEEGERAIEVDPRWVEPDYLDLLLDLGFNRFSFGVQDLEPSVQNNINRVLSVERLTNVVTQLQGRGMKAVNLDLIYGLPGQTPESFATTVDRIISLSPSRLAVFGYAHVPWVSPHQKKMEHLEIPGAELRMELCGIAFDKLLDAGFKHVGFDHFARPEDELITALESRTLNRNFMGYTTRKGLDLVGMGASGISSVGFTYAQNEKEIGDYVGGAGKSRWSKAFLMSDEDILRRDVIMDLLCNFHLDTRRVEQEFNIDFAAHFAAELGGLQGFVDDGLLEVADDEINVTRLGRYFVRNIAMTFDLYLHGEGDKSQRYSKTI